MSMEFDKSFSVVVGEEGYESNLRGDPGGLTIFGISGEYHPELVKEMMSMSREDALAAAKTEYELDYWIPAGCDSLAWPLCLVAFDTSVNQGQGIARRFIKQSNGNWQTMIALRKARYEQTAKDRPEEAGDLPGWLNRLANIEKVAREPLT